MILDSKKTVAGVVLAHAAAFYLLTQAQRPQAPQEPIFMQAVPLAMGEVAPEPKPEPQKAQPKVKEKIKEVHQNIRQKVQERKAPTPRVQQAATPERSATMEVAAAKTTQTEEVADRSGKTANESAAAPSSGGQEGQSRQAEPVVSEPSFHANYLSNPKPPYPPASAALGEYGTVLLRVRVNAAGLTEQVEISKSSGYVRLDASAERTVQRWRFVPAKRGDVAVAGTVIVPIKFLKPNT